MRLLILGSSGLVGRNALRYALDNPAISAVIAPTRRPLPAHPKLTNPISDRLDDLLPQVPDWKLSAAICALGTTKAKAGSQENFRLVDYVFPVEYAMACHSNGVEEFAVVSAIGASVTSRFPYARTKGELERDLRGIHFRSLTILRPSIISGDRGEYRFAESLALGLARVLAPILPKKFHVNPATKIARVLLDSVIIPSVGCRMIYAEDLN